MYDFCKRCCKVFNSIRKAVETIILIAATLTLVACVVQLLTFCLCLFGLSYTAAIIISITAISIMLFVLFCYGYVWYFDNKKKPGGQEYEIKND